MILDQPLTRTADRTDQRYLNELCEEWQSNDCGPHTSYLLAVGSLEAVTAAAQRSTGSLEAVPATPASAPVAPAAPETPATDHRALRAPVAEGQAVYTLSAELTPYAALMLNDCDTCF